MQSLWNQDEAAACNGNPLALRVYTSRLLGREPSLVLHGGGNTSVKATVANLFGEEEEILYVKGSGWDLATIEAPGFAPVKLDVLKKMAELPELTDTDMVKNQRAAMTDPGAPNPSVEAILHAVIPFAFVDHTHADAVVTITNTPDGEARIKELYGDTMLIIPYVMPGFILARTIYEMTRGIDWSKYKGMVLLNHGIFTFHDDAKVSYERMVAAVDKAEKYIREQNALTFAAPQKPTVDLEALSRLRKAIGGHRGKPVVARLDADDASVEYANRSNAMEITRGPLTPDHVIRTKPWPVFLGDDVETSVNKYAEAYQAYFDRNDDGSLTCLSPAPCWAVWPGRGIVSFGAGDKEANIISDIVSHTLPAIRSAEAMGGYTALAEKDIFEMEYWELEQAKLKKGGSAPAFQGKVALVTGGASGIGRACVEAFAAQGACVAALDLNPAVQHLFNKNQILGIPCDVTDGDALKAAVEAAVRRFGGLDAVVCNAGIFPPSMEISDMDDAVWQKSLDINLTAHRRLLTYAAPYLKNGFDPAVVMIASKNVPAPGPGAAAYSVAKAGQTQLARVAALELGGYGVRVNSLHPNQVFDTGIWTEEVLRKRAAHYGLSVEEYKTNNVLKTEVRSSDVADLVLAMAGPLFGKTTGAQVAIDGGNERVI